MILGPLPVLLSSNRILHSSPFPKMRNLPFQRNEEPRSPHSAALHLVIILSTGSNNVGSR